MCDFKPGDEIVAIDDGGPGPGLIPPLVVGRVYVCSALDPHTYPCGQCGSEIGVDIEEVGSHPTQTYCHCSFRKVQRRDLGAWLKTETTFEEPKRTKVDAFCGGKQTTLSSRRCRLRRCASRARWPATWLTRLRIACWMWPEA